MVLRWHYFTWKYIYMLTEKTMGRQLLGVLEDRHGA